MICDSPKSGISMILSFAVKNQENRLGSLEIWLSKREIPGNAVLEAKS